MTLKEKAILIRILNEGKYTEEELKENNKLFKKLKKKYNCMCYEDAGARAFEVLENIYNDIIEKNNIEKNELNLSFIEFYNENNKKYDYEELIWQYTDIHGYELNDSEAYINIGSEGFFVFKND
ncbi:hypothetical protein [Cetobacterium sp.]|uniref:hypothetical protein n=1 Tax=Cetobacterium sp. TaxID=2071632 RepID=UPI003F3ACD7C